MGFLFLGETHFGATWLFFFDQNNWDWLKKKPLVHFVAPITLVILLWWVASFVSMATAFLIIATSSAFHVVRQSIGMAKIFSSKDSEILNVSLLGIYIFSGLFLLIGFLRFYTEFSIPQQLLSNFQLLALIGPVIFLLVVYMTKKENKESMKFFAVVFTGLILYSPFCFVERIEHAAVIGVGMHWCQYLGLTLPIYLRKSQHEQRQGKSNLMIKISHTPWKLIGYLFGYSTLMLMFYKWGVDWNTYDRSFLVMIPMSFQLLHFYYDAFIWRFSDPHIRQEVGKYIFSH